jgi:hypothetical protein
MTSQNNNTETEIPLHASVSLQRRTAVWLTALVGVLALALVGATSSHAEPGSPNNYECSGSIKGGVAEPGAEGTPVAYAFSCNGPITGYQLQSQIFLGGLQASPVVNNEHAEPTKEAFECGGEVPGFALNCVGTAYAAYDQISGQFYIETKLCAEPREDTLLTVTYAYLEKGVVTQAISGPFDLGRPLGCPYDAEQHWTRLNPNPKAAVPSTTNNKSTKGKGKGKSKKGKGKKK